MSADGLADLMVSVDSPLIIVTTSAEGERAGCLVGFHSQSSISPAHYCFWLSKANHTYRASLRSFRFAIHFLSTDDLKLARRFGSVSGEDTDKFADLDVSAAEGGVPLLTEVPNRIVVERLAMLDDGGDHVAVTARPVSVQTAGRFEPLRGSHLGDLTPGHASDERAIHP